MVIHVCLSVRLTVYWAQLVSRVCLGVWVAGMMVDSMSCSLGGEASLGGTGGTALQSHPASTPHLHVIIIIVIKGHKKSYKFVYRNLREGLLKQRGKMLFQHLFTSEKQEVFENTQAVTLL